MTRPVIVVYDVSDDTRRARVRAVLAPFADRFQYSGWLIPARANIALPRAAAMLTAVIALEDRLRLLAPCASCRHQAQWLPTQQPFTLDEVTGWMIEGDNQHNQADRNRADRTDEHHSGENEDAGPDRGGAGSGT